MKTEIVVVVENTASSPALAGEYGLSMFISGEGGGLLFDTGAGKALTGNMQALGITPDQVEKTIISHGHFDHAGGLPAWLEYAGARTVCLHPFALHPKFVPGGENGLFIGMPDRERIEAMGGELIFNEAPAEIAPGIILTGTIPRRTGFEDTGGAFQVEIDGIRSEDLLPDDQALVIDHPSGLIIISGCAHSGMINTIEYALELTGKKRIQAFIGGTHLMSATPERMDMTVERLSTMDLGFLAVAHCTGFTAAARLYSALGGRVVKADSGSRYVF